MDTSTVAGLCWASLHVVLDGVRGREAQVLRCMAGGRAGGEGLWGGGGGGLELPLGAALPLGDNYELLLEGVFVRGLDSLSSVSVLEPIADSNVALRSSVSFSALELRLHSLMRTLDGQSFSFWRLILRTVTPSSKLF